MVQLRRMSAQLANDVGVTPQSLSRASAALRPLGVSGSGREVSIIDPRLRNFARSRALRSHGHRHLVNRSRAVPTDSSRWFD
jgi:hypothetical protein